MIRISQIKLPVNHTEKDLLAAINKQLKFNKKNHGVLAYKYKIVRKSIDARKDDIKYIYTVDIIFSDTNQSAANEKKGKDFELSLVRKLNNNHITVSKPTTYDFKPCGSERLNSRPVIIGCGPAGLFCAYTLALKGYRPIVIERGESVEERKITVDSFFTDHILNTESNVQFGEGGAGTFSDGKLNTMVKDQWGRNHFVLETFVKFGADEKIMYMSKPHIGTDVLSVVVKNMRGEAIKLGAEFIFNTKMTDFDIKNGKIVSVETFNSKSGECNKIPCEVLVLAIGHSARDTFQLLYEKKLNMEPKAFAVGVRIEHPREMIDLSQYGNKKDMLPAADYKLTAKVGNGRGVYSFCMCPGGYVVNSSSESGFTCVNGMSYSGRNGINSNSAIIVTVTPDDFPDNTALGGLSLQRELEKAAYREGESKVPVQMFGDFKKNMISTGLGEVSPQIKGAIRLSNLRNIFPEYISYSLIKGIDEFASKIHDYNRYDAVISGVESRTSSPLRILRNDALVSSVEGIYPCGEGAGYAGGITSAAMDGIKVFEAISFRYAPLTD